MTKAQKKIVDAALAAHPVVVGVRVLNNSCEGGRDTHYHGDVAIRVGVYGPARISGARYDVANKLRELAEVISGTVGDPIDSAEIVVLLRRAR